MLGAAVLEGDLTDRVTGWLRVRLEAARQRPRGVGGIAGRAAIGPQVRRVGMPGM